MNNRLFGLISALLVLVGALVGCERTPLDVLLPNQPPVVSLS